MGRVDRVARLLWATRRRVTGFSGASNISTLVSLYRAGRIIGSCGQPNGHERKPKGLRPNA
jgi:hypothetical protein